MSNNKACEMDGCKAEFFKWAPKDILKFLVLIFNKVFYDHNTSLFPKHWAISRVVPIYKKGNTHEPSNYRFISVSITLYNIFNKILANRVEKFLT